MTYVFAILQFTKTYKFFNQHFNVLLQIILVGIFAYIKLTKFNDSTVETRPILAPGSAAIINWYLGIGSRERQRWVRGGGRSERKRQRGVKEIEKWERGKEMERDIRENEGKHGGWSYNAYIKWKVQEQL